MPGTYVDERTVVANVLDGFSGLVGWPGSDFTTPAPGTDPGTPVSYVLAEVEYDRAERCDMNGGAQIEGRVVLHLWIERNSGDNLVREHAETLRTLFASGDDVTHAFYFLEPVLGPAFIGGENGEWYGRRMDVPFTRFR